MFTLGMALALTAGLGVTLMVAEAVLYFVDERKPTGPVQARRRRF